MTHLPGEVALDVAEFRRVIEAGGPYTPVQAVAASLRLRQPPRRRWRGLGLGRFPAWSEDDHLAHLLFNGQRAVIALGVLNGVDQ